jgi:CHAT domain-containing protein
MVHGRRTGTLLALTMSLLTTPARPSATGATSEVRVDRTVGSAQHVETALQIQQATLDSDDEASAILELARLERSRGQLEPARAHAEKALTLIESQRPRHTAADVSASSFLATRHDGYELLTDLLMQLHAQQPLGGYDRLAFETSERGKARSLADAAQTDQQTLSVSALQERVLDDETVLLTYALGAERSFLWSVTKSGFTSYTLPARETIEAASRRVHRLLSVSYQRLRRRETERAVSELARMVLRPATDQLTSRRIAIVADGGLQFVPFGALRLEAEPLVRGHEVVHLPSASTLAVLRRETANRPRAPKFVAVFADPVFSADDRRVPRQAGLAARHDVLRIVPDRPGTDDRSESVPDPIRATRAGLGRLDRLVSTRREAESIRALAAGSDALIALDFEANRARALGSELQQYQIVHFATHGLIDSRDPDLSGLVLSLVDQNGRPQDGFLRSQDIYKLRLAADLVVLSACRTALGEEIHGEGLNSLVRGFMYAGAPRVVASLWDVRDDATAELMERFYAGIIRDGLTPAAALRAAQIWMSQRPRWSAPYYWAGFILQGEWQE